MHKYIKFATTACRRLYWVWNDFLWLLPRSVRKIIIGTTTEKMNLTIYISTYIERFEESFIPTLTKLHELFPLEEIIVVANGHYDHVRQAEYLKELRKFCSQFPNVELFDFMEPVCISKMSNTVTLNRRNDIRFSVNDDIRMSLLLPRFLHSSGMLREQFSTINYSWAYTVSLRAVFSKVGFGDERLPEIGGEDDDYAARCAIAGIEIKNYNTRRIGSRGKKAEQKGRLNSWGKDMSKQKGGYSSLNYDFLFNKKWETSNEAFAGATFVPNRTPRFWKLRPGMETPNFYPDKKL